MFKSLVIENFRGFKHLEVGPLESVNLIAAKNNGGKTALLEAIWMLLHPDDPLQITWLNSQRGIASVRIGYAAIWEWLFHDRRYERATASVSAETMSGWDRLNLRLARQPGPAKMDIPGMAENLDPERLRIRDRLFLLSMSYMSHAGQPQETLVEPKGDLRGNLSWSTSFPQLPDSHQGVFRPRRMVHRFCGDV